MHVYQARPQHCCEQATSAWHISAWSLSISSALINHKLHTKPQCMKCKHAIVQHDAPQCHWCTYSGSKTSSFCILYYDIVYDVHIRDHRLLRSTYCMIHIFRIGAFFVPLYYCIITFASTCFIHAMPLTRNTYSGSTTLSFMMYCLLYDAHIQERRHSLLWCTAYCMMHIFRIGDNLFYDVLYSIFMIILDAAHIQDRRHSLLGCIA